MAEKRVHRKPRNGNNHQPGDRGADGIRLSPADDHRARAKIETTKVINRLNNFVLGEAEKAVKRIIIGADGKEKEITIYVPVMTATQVVAALGLLRKTVPDLSNLVLQGDPNNPVRLEIATSSREYIIEELTKIGRLKKQEDGTYLGDA